MPHYEGTIKLASSNLMTLIGEILAGVESPGTPLPAGVVRVRSSPLPGGGFGPLLGAPAEVSAPITNGHFAIDVPEGPLPVRRRLLIERSNGAASVPIYRSLDLPPTSTANLDIRVRVLDSEDAQALANLDVTSDDPDPTIITSAEIDAAARAEADRDRTDQLLEASGRVEDGYIKIDFKYLPFPDLQRLKINGTITLEPEPSRAYDTDRLVDLDFVRVDFRRLAATVEDTRKVRARAEAAMREMNRKLAAKFHDKLERLGSKQGGTVTVISAVEPGSELRLLVAFGFLVPPPA